MLKDTVAPCVSHAQKILCELVNFAALQWWIQLCPRLAGAYCVLFLCMYCVPSLLHFHFNAAGTIQKRVEDTSCWANVDYDRICSDFGHVPSVYAKVPWPHTFVEFTSPLRLFNLEVFSFFSLSSALSLSHDEMFVLHWFSALIVALLVHTLHLGQLSTSLLQSWKEAVASRAPLHARSLQKFDVSNFASLPRFIYHFVSNVQVHEILEVMVNILPLFSTQSQPWHAFQKSIVLSPRLR